MQFEANQGFLENVPGLPKNARKCCELAPRALKLIRRYFLHTTSCRNKNACNKLATSNSKSHPKSKKPQPFARTWLQEVPQIEKLDEATYTTQGLQMNTKQWLGRFRVISKAFCQKTYTTNKGSLLGKSTRKETCMEGSW